MKISIFSTFFPFRGGIAQFSANVFRALEKSADVKAFTFTRQYPNFLFPGQTQFVTQKDQVDKIPAVRCLDSINPFTYFLAAKKIRKEASELFISNYWMTFFGPSLGILAKGLRKKSKRVAILHNVIPHEKRFFDTFFNRIFLKNHDGFVVLSDAVLKDLLQLNPAAKYLRIDHPIYDHFGNSIDEVEARDKLAIPSEKKVLLFFGFIRGYKGLDVLLNALSALDDSYHLIVAGEVYGEFDSYQEIINGANLSNRITLINSYINDEEVSLYFSAADVCVLPYKSATQSGITAISHHFNLPVIATDVGGLKETIQHLETGMIVPEADPELIKTAIEEYFEAEYKSVFSEKIKANKKENSWDNFALELIEFSKSL